MLTRPNLDGMMVADATSPIKFQFNVQGGDQVVGHHVQCINNTSGVIVHEHKAMSFLLTCTIDGNVLTNGYEYRIRVRTYNADINADFSNENDSTTSHWSDYMLIKCFTNGMVDIINIPVDITGNRIIKNQTFTFEGIYTQKENVGLKSYRYILYDRDKIAIQIYPEVYQLDGILKQEVTGFKSDVEYYIELVTLNQYDIEARSELIHFRVDYSPPRITQILKVENDEENALVKIDAQIVQMLLQSDGDYIFENYQTYLRDRTLQEITSKRIAEISDLDILGLTKERVVNNIGAYTSNSYRTDSPTSYSITTNPETAQDIFFINLENTNSKAWIDDAHGLNMEFFYTMNVWAESIVENKVFLTISSKQSIAEFCIVNGYIHCIEDYMGVRRHTKESIVGYVPNRPMHIFVQKRENGYMRMKGVAIV